ncbi:SusC/RagA family TonB-linked outer membrane protein [Fulvitalea axinellae]|uniref:SusC/RagA family TonB-linked outer membrane protein n=1 Tax=Fulvitalea axinellae TaxID=1182444 RepID=A0AAU9C879_9BACT|nr:SusC/RagA family TonB-linked outer membrane protein [Fulvitalea axinellae]
MRKLLLLAGLYLLAFNAIAQDRVLIKGHVKDSEGEALIGANILEVDADGRFVTGTVTDFNGFYMIKIDPKNRLKVSFIGFKERFLDLNGQSTIDVVLDDGAQQLNVVTVEAEPQNDDGISLRDIPMSVKKVDITELDPIGATSVDQMLQGRVSGVDIMSFSGDPGAGMQIRIRGTATILGNREPLFIVDGVPFDTETSNFDFQSADVRDFGALLAIAPEDIKDIEISKDAASAAIWGSRAANGIISITTKRGRKSKPRIQYSYQSTWENLRDPIPMLNAKEYVTMQKEMYFNVRGNIYENTNPVIDLSDDSFDGYQNYRADTDWLDAITQQGRRDNHHISVSGGGDKVRYRSSIGFLTHQGTTKGTNLDRLSVKTNLDYNISKRLKFTTDISYTRNDRDALYFGNTREVAYRKMPNMSIYEYDVEGNLTGNYFNGSWDEPYQSFDWANRKNIPFFNPVAVTDESTNNTLEDRLRTTFRLQYNITDYLMIKSDISFDAVNNRYRLFLSESSINAGPWDDAWKNKVSKGSSSNFRVQTFTNLIYTPNLGEDHALTSYFRWNTDEGQGTNFRVEAGSSASEKLTEPARGGRLISFGAGSGPYRNLGGVWNTHYKWKDRYIVSGGFRVEASSNFGADTRWGMFPMGSVGWKLAQEPFLADAEWLNEFTLRSSYGVNGIAPGAGQNYAFYSTEGKQGDTKYAYQYLNELGVAPSNVQLRNLSWEKIHQFDIGFEMFAFGDRLSVVFDYYQKNSEDLIMNVALPRSTGYDSHLKNWGQLSNKGVEFSIDATPVKTKDWRVDLGFNIAHNINTVKEVNDNLVLTKGDMLKNGQYGTRLVIGDPIGGFYGYLSDGVYEDKKATIAKDKFGNPIPDYTGKNEFLYMKMGDPGQTEFQAGDARYKDINNDGIINELDVVYLGSSNPDFTGGANFRVSYRGLSISGLFHFRQGFEILNAARMHTENMTNTDNQSKATLRRWRKDGDVTDIPRPIFNTGFNWLGSDRFVEDGSYIRLKNVSLNYRFEREFLKRFGLRDLNVFTTFYNLFTITDYTGQDPEVGLGANPFSFGVDNSRTPPARSVIFGLSVSL